MSRRQQRLRVWRPLRRCRRTPLGRVRSGLPERPANCPQRRHRTAARERRGAPSIACELRVARRCCCGDGVAGGEVTGGSQLALGIRGRVRFGVVAPTHFVPSFTVGAAVQRVRSRSPGLLAHSRMREGLGENAFSAGTPRSRQRIGGVVRQAFGMVCRARRVVLLGGCCDFTDSIGSA